MHRVGDLKLVHYPVRFRSPGAKPPQWQVSTMHDMTYGNIKQDTILFRN